MKTAIVYCSTHPGNTKKLVDAIAARYDVTCIDAAQTQAYDLTDYDLIGFASGIYFSKFHKSVLQFAQQNLPARKRVFFLYTCGAEKDSYTKAIEALARQKDARIAGSFGCLGYDTYGPFRLVGGIAKGHPDAADLDAAVRFYGGLAGC